MAQTDERTLASWWHAHPLLYLGHDCRHHFYNPRSLRRLQKPLKRVKVYTHSGERVYIVFEVDLRNMQQHFFVDLISSWLSFLVFDLINFG